MPELQFVISINRLQILSIIDIDEDITAKKMMMPIANTTTH